MTSLSIFCLVCIAGGDPGNLEVGPPTGADIVSPDARLELLYTRSASIAGGPCRFSAHL